MAVSLSFVAKPIMISNESKPYIDQFCVPNFGRLHIMTSVYNCFMERLRDLLRQVHQYEPTGNSVNSTTEYASCTVTVNLLGLNLTKEELVTFKENLELMMSQTVIRQERMMHTPYVMNLGEAFDVCDVRSYISKNDPGQMGSAEAIDDPQAIQIVRELRQLGLESAPAANTP